MATMGRPDDPISTIQRTVGQLCSIAFETYLMIYIQQGICDFESDIIVIVEVYLKSMANTDIHILEVCLSLGFKINLVLLEDTILNTFQM